MVRAGLGPGWTCRFANDFDERKAAAYRANWGDGGELKVGDVRGVAVEDLPGRADLMWGSFPCQDLSVAGAGAGLRGDRSGAFFPFWKLVTELATQHRAPRIVAVENVRGTLTADGGEGFAAICEAYAGAGYCYGPLMIDAALFVPQSRPRLFIIGVAPDIRFDRRRIADAPTATFHTPGLVAAMQGKPRAVLWRLPSPVERSLGFASLIEDEVADRLWHSSRQTADLLGLMAPIHRAKVEAVRGAGGRTVGAVYRRTRRTPDGRRVQRAEVRFDGMAGCLRTPGGGSSRQTVLIVEAGEVRSRLLTPRETARLMGLPESYILPSNANAAYHLTGDGVVTDVVRHLARNLFEPLLANCSPSSDANTTRRQVPSLQA